LIPWFDLIAKVVPPEIEYYCQPVVAITKGDAISEL